MTPLIAMAVHDTTENGRTEYTRATLDRLIEQGHRPFVISNGSCAATTDYLRELPIRLIELPENIGTAKAINIAWQHRAPGQHCVKMDNDVLIHDPLWLDRMIEAVTLEPTIGIVGLKRKDCWECPTHRDPFYQSTLDFLPHTPGHPWKVIEYVNHVMGTCQLYNSDLLDRIGYLYQPRLYGFDDALAAVRCQVAGFRSAFLPTIEIDHIDRGDTEYQGWKEKHAGEDMDEYARLRDAYKKGTRTIFEPATW